MIERLLAAERALEAGQDEVAERLFAQVAAADPRNAIAVVGLARVARRRGDAGAALAHARRALEIDAEDAAARRLLDELSAPVAPTAASPAAPWPAAATAPATAGRPAWHRRGLVGRLVRLLLGHD